MKYSLWGARFAAGGAAPSMYYARGLTLRNSDGSATTLDDDATVVVSEPLDQGEHDWSEVPVGSIMHVNHQGVQIEPLGI